MQTHKAGEVRVGCHPDGYRIDRTAAPMDRYTRWRVSPEGRWSDPRPVCFHELPGEGWVETDGFERNGNEKPDAGQGRHER